MSTRFTFPIHHPPPPFIHLDPFFLLLLPFPLSSAFPFLCSLFAMASHFPGTVYLAQPPPGTFQVVSWPPFGVMQSISHSAQFPPPPAFSAMQVVPVRVMSREEWQEMARDRVARAISSDDFHALDSLCDTDACIPHLIATEAFRLQSPQALQWLHSKAPISASQAKRLLLQAAVQERPSIITCLLELKFAWPSNGLDTVLFQCVREKKSPTTALTLAWQHKCPLSPSLPIALLEMGLGKVLLQLPFNIDVTQDLISDAVEAGESEEVVEFLARRYLHQRQKPRKRGQLED